MRLALHYFIMFMPQLIWDIISVLKLYLVPRQCNTNAVLAADCSARTPGYLYLQSTVAVEYITLQLGGDLLC